MARKLLIITALVSASNAAPLPAVRLRNATVNMAVSLSDSGPDKTFKIFTNTGLNTLFSIDSGKESSMTDCETRCRNFPDALCGAFTYFDASLPDKIQDDTVSKCPHRGSSKGILNPSDPTIYLNGKAFQDIEGLVTNKWGDDERATVTFNGDTSGCFEEPAETMRGRCYLYGYEVRAGDYVGPYPALMTAGNHRPAWDYGIAIGLVPNDWTYQGLGGITAPKVDQFESGWFPEKCSYAPLAFQGGALLCEGWKRQWIFGSPHAQSGFSQDFIGSQASIRGWTLVGNADASQAAVIDLGTAPTIEACQNKCHDNEKCQAWTHFNEAAGDKKGMCLGRTDTERPWDDAPNGVSMKGIANSGVVENAAPNVTVTGQWKFATIVSDGVTQEYTLGWTVEQTDGKAGSQEQMKGYSNTHEVSEEVGFEMFGVTSNTKYGFSATTTEQSTIASSWNRARAQTESKECKLTLTGVEGEVRNAWVWILKAESKAPGMPKLDYKSCQNNQILILPQTCDGNNQTAPGGDGNTRCEPRCAPGGGADSTYQTCLSGFQYLGKRSTTPSPTSPAPAPTPKPTANPNPSSPVGFVCKGHNLPTDQGTNIAFNPDGTAGQGRDSCEAACVASDACDAFAWGHGISPTVCYLKTGFTAAGAVWDVTRNAGLRAKYDFCYKP